MRKGPGYWVWADGMKRSFPEPSFGEMIDAFVERGKLRELLSRIVFHIDRNVMTKELVEEARAAAGEVEDE